MKIFVYETESMCHQGGGVEVRIVLAADRESANQVMLRDTEWLHDAKHLQNCFKVEEKTLEDCSTVFVGNVLERFDDHQYS